MIGPRSIEASRFRLSESVELIYYFKRPFPIWGLTARLIIFVRSDMMRVEADAPETTAIEGNRILRGLVGRGSLASLVEGGALLVGRDSPPCRRHAGLTRIRFKG